ncbi:MAG: DEAD/DEAH box helicase, partial [Schleiferiaceae bacterium]|nr:DEAD/DEAH box helicase [Schleiferiaceae bacterium]
MKLITNQDTLLLDDLADKIVAGVSRVSISVNYFTAPALADGLKSLQRCQSIRILLGNAPEWPAHHFLSSEGESLRSRNLDQRYRLQQVARLLNNKAEIRLGSLANQQVILIENENKTFCYNLSPQNLDAVALGTIEAPTPSLIQVFEDQQDQYKRLFEQSWQNSTTALGDQIQQIFENGAQYRTPQQLYKYAMREVFEYSTVSERADEKLQRVGFKDSKVWDMLYNFQKDAVLGAIEKIETFGGCIIADSVGLGKTFEALAVMKYYQLRNDRILVLAPKKLRENWTVYQLNDKRNVLAEDRLNYDVLNHTDLSREKGKSGDIDLEMINWGNYDLVVIDESHNFRNNPNKKGITRYQRLMQDVIKSNIRTKVLMLSATPVNNRLTDLRNQVAFIT